mmetsp:Transcript_8554/g.14211  ORF Transcript_8554/g.14211 Transcript_8554/m.14211 type:complete len:219 (-) Transcript_8554:156-812(-)|eukprot:CAMPEP_0119008790 /NCGR_PEP_ID=MMETSP1176-20130426/3940_1 /TAXON_ID=265551 /ORGANISM="Synedropsis recta cf, Strain CCMP1620" /LENGTH=218 /DNA_ID=CAMNT_0006961189 /DNA_START=206 /DNA_END=862 /DNA_ORIENTATION=+
MSSLQQAAQRYAKRSREGDGNIMDDGDPQLQHMVKRLRVNDSKSPSPSLEHQQQQQQQHLQQQQQQKQAYLPQHYQQPNQQHSQSMQQRQYQFQQQQQQRQEATLQPAAARQQHRAVLPYHSNLLSATVQTPPQSSPFHQQSFHPHPSTTVVAPYQQQHPGQGSKEPPLVSPMNRLLGSLHQQRRQQQQRGRTNEHHAAGTHQLAQQQLPSNSQLFDE